MAVVCCSFAQGSGATPLLSGYLIGWLLRSRRPRWSMLIGSVPAVSRWGVDLFCFKVVCKYMCGGGVVVEVLVWWPGVCYCVTPLRPVGVFPWWRQASGQLGGGWVWCPLLVESCLKPCPPLVTFNAVSGDPCFLPVR